ncbi:hypothetical protein, partial [Paenibacillus aceti]|uniref:hypothetical protein n=1 Tax=Paenibacillus aceti TaxID=1820010 RepID=UPI001E36370E
FDHEASQEADSTSNLEFSRAFRCSRTHYVRCAPHARLHPTFSVLKTGIFEPDLKVVQKVFF